MSLLTPSGHDCASSCTAVPHHTAFLALACNHLSPEQTPAELASLSRGNGMAYTTRARRAFSDTKGLVFCPACGYAAPAGKMDPHLIEYRERGVCPAMTPYRAATMSTNSPNL